MTSTSSPLTLSVLDRKASQKHSKVRDTRRTVQGAIGLMVVLGCAIILNFMQFNAESGSETIAWFFIIFNGLQGKTWVSLGSGLGLVSVSFGSRLGLVWVWLRPGLGIIDTVSIILISRFLDIFIPCCSQR